jgi:hypothetical protein
MYLSGCAARMAPFIGSGNSKHRAVNAPGGARPKALVHDDSGEWLAKFTSRARDAAYDVTGRGEHTLSFQQGHGCPTRQEIIGLAAEWGVARAAAIVEDIVKAAKTFATTARRLKVRYPGSLQKVCADVRRRTELLSR